MFSQSRFCLALLTQRSALTALSVLTALASLTFSPAAEAQEIETGAAVETGTEAETSEGTEADSKANGGTEAEAEADTNANAAESKEQAEPARITFGARAFAGLLLEGEADGGLYGGNLLLAVEVIEHLEIEGSVFLAKSQEPDPFAGVELIGKWVFERERSFAPHIVLGPLLSIDFKNPATFSAGLVAGGGATWWLSPRVGLTGDLNYRLLIGEEIGNAFTAALGVAFRPF